jgi:hypothetical protein
MSRYRLFLPLLFALALLLAQQAGIAHTLQHTLAGHQQDKQTPHNHSCQLCALDAQFGSTLHSAAVSFALPLLSPSAWSQEQFLFQHVHTLAATARGPPALFQQFA